MKQNKVLIGAAAGIAALIFIPKILIGGAIIGAGIYGYNKLTGK